MQGKSGPKVSKNGLSACSKPSVPVQECIGNVSAFDLGKFSTLLHQPVASNMNYITSLECQLVGGVAECSENLVYATKVG